MTTQETIIRNFHKEGINITYATPSRVAERTFLLFAESSTDLDAAIAFLRESGRTIVENSRVAPEDDSDGEGYVEISY